MDVRRDHTLGPPHYFFENNQVGTRFFFEDNQSQYGNDRRAKCSKLVRQGVALLLTYQMCACNTLSTVHLHRFSVFVSVFLGAANRMASIISLPAESRTATVIVA